MAANAQNLVWIDLEMTGLDVDKDVIIEIATIVTDANLTILAEGPVLALHQPKSVMDNMNEWCRKTHGNSGLTDRVLQSEITLAQAEQQTLAFLQQYAIAGKSPMCGNSICQDRQFLHRHMPNLLAFFHYRNLDVSTIKELAMRWYPDVYAKVTKISKHLALDDIKESIDELNFYREHIFMANPQPIANS